MVLDGVDYQISRVLTPRFSQDIGSVLIDSTFGYKQRVGDFVVGFSATDVKQDLRLPLGKLLRTILRNGRWQ